MDDRATPIDSGGKGGDFEPLPPRTPSGKRKLSSNYMTRRTFAGLLFGMGYSFDKAVRKARITKTAASEEVLDHGYAEWRRRQDERTRRAA